MHYTWADPYRASRITEVLGSGRLFSVAEMARLQNDDLSIPARALVPLLKDVAVSNAPPPRRRATLLLAWDFVMDKDVGARRHLRHVAAPPVGQRPRA